MAEGERPKWMEKYEVKPGSPLDDEKGRREIEEALQRDGLGHTLHKAEGRDLEKYTRPLNPEGVRRDEQN